jgi:hypothetical protein
MPLTDTFTKTTEHSGAPAGDKHTDGGGMYLLVKAGGKYWRMDYKFADKRITRTLGVYSAVSLAKARSRREKARELLDDELDGGLKVERCSQRWQNVLHFSPYARQTLKTAGT